MMRLVEAGKVNLDATVRTYLPTFATSDPAVAQKVTVRQLLEPRSGFTSPRVPPGLRAGG